MDEMTLEQQRALALARARVRAQQAPTPAPQQAQAAVPIPTYSQAVTNPLNPVALTEGLANLGSGMIAKPASDIAGLMGIAAHATGLTDTDPTDVKARVQEAMTYQPRTEGGNLAAEYNPVALAGKAIGKVADVAGDAVEGDPTKASSLRHVLASGVKEVVPLLPMALGARGVTRAPAKAAEEAASSAFKRRNTIVKDTALAEGGKLGLKASPLERGAGTIAKGIESLGGPASVQHGISLKNQPVINDIIRKDVGLAPDAPLTHEVIKTAQQTHYAPYEQAKAIGTVELGNNIPSHLEGVNKGFNVATGKPSYTLDASKVVEQVKQLRSDGFELRYKASKDSDPSLKREAKSMLKTAKFLDDALEQAAIKSGAPELVNQLRQSRESIAKLHSVDRALRNGNVDAGKLAKISEKEPLSGDTKVVAEFAKHVPGSTKLSTKASSLVENSSMLASATRLIAKGAMRGLAAHPRPVGQPTLRSNVRVPASTALTVSALRAQQENEGE